MIPVKIKLEENAKMPFQATEHAACYDVFAHRIEYLDERNVYVHLGFSLEFNHSWKVVLVPRSSLTKTDWIIQNTPGQGDADFRDTYQIRFKALPVGISNFHQFPRLQYPEFPYQVGDRIGQIYFSPVLPPTFEIVSELSETERLGGFGSTGK